MFISVRPRSTTQPKAQPVQIPKSPGTHVVQLRLLRPIEHTVLCSIHALPIMLGFSAHRRLLASERQTVPHVHSICSAGSQPHSSKRFLA